MNFSAFSIKNPLPAIMLFVLLSFAGVMAFKSMAVQDFPDIELPAVIVSAELDGAAPIMLETEVARKLENAVATLEGVEYIFTSVRTGEVAITIFFELDKNPAEVVNDVRSAVTRIRSQLPSELTDPTVAKVSSVGHALLVFTVISDKLDEQEVSWFVDNTVAKKLLTVPGVGSVKRLGGVNREVLIELDATKMASLNLTALDVSRKLKLVQQEASGGMGRVGGIEQGVRTIATVKSAADLASIELPFQVKDGDSRKIRLDQVANIIDTFSERDSIALENGKAVVGIEIFRARGASEVDVARGAREVIAQIQTEYPNIKLSQIIDNVAPVEESFDDSMNMLYEGALLAVIVVWLFLRDGRATLVVAVALPLSVIPAFVGMKLFGFTLNTVTLLALALVVGILVDDAIVEVENISRHLRMGKTPRQAATEAADEIGLAVIATTFALIAVFLPTAFMSGVSGKFFKQFGWTAVLAIFASLVVARLLTPMMAAYVLKQPNSAEKKSGRLMGHYLRSMHWLLSHRFITVITAALFFAGSISLAGLLPTGFVPEKDRGQTQINLELPPGSTLAETFALAESARIVAQSLPNVKMVFSSVGGGSSGGTFASGTVAEKRRAVLTLLLSGHNDRAESIKEIEAQIRSKLTEIPGARFQVGPPDGGAKMQIVMISDDPASLIKVAGIAEHELRTLKGIGGITSSASLVQSEIIVRPDFARAADLGVTAASIGEAVRVATLGDYDIDLTKLNLSDRQIPIRVKLPDALRTDLDSLKRLTVPGKNSPIMLANVANIAVESGLAQIDRMNRSRKIELNVDLGSRSLGELYQEAMQLPVFKNLPARVKIAELGDTREMKKLFASFGVAMTIGILCIYGVLVLLFKDFMQPITILAALPLSFGGAFVALLLTHSALSMPSMIGLVMLMGIVTKNSILLVEYAIVARRSGMDRIDALIDACRKRSRPILMTTLAMIAGMLPLALGFGSDPSFRAPMAIAVIGGLVSSTLLSLLVVPAVFTYIDDGKQRLTVWLLKLAQRS